MIPPEAAQSQDRISATVSAASAPPTRWERTKANLRTIAGAVFLAMVIRVVLFEAFEIDGPSMEPTLLDGDRVVVAKFMYGLFLPFSDEAVFTWDKPDIGDVIIIKSPADNIDIVKRVVGLPGDTVQVQRNRVLRNGKSLGRRVTGPCPSAKVEPRSGKPSCVWTRERNGSASYLTSQDPHSFQTSTAAVKVPEGYIYVLGDHRDHSNDSRFFGPVPINRIKGKSLLVYWSSGDEGFRWGRLAELVR